MSLTLGGCAEAARRDSPGQTVGFQELAVANLAESAAQDGASMRRPPQPEGILGQNPPPKAPIVTVDVLAFHKEPFSNTRTDPETFLVRNARPHAPALTADALSSHEETCPVIHTDEKTSSVRNARPRA